MENLQVKRWQRYGNDRLYVSGPDGQPIGWLDLKTGERHLDDPERADLFEMALVGRPEVPSHFAPAAPSIPRPEPHPEVSSPPSTDLASNRPGQAVAARAAALRQQAPVMTLLARTLGIHTDEQAWRVGGKGEEKVGHQLEKLRPRWEVLHSIPIGKGDSDIDHFAVGPGGVFTVNAKHHPHKSVWVGGDTFMVDGHRQPYVRNARFEADRASRLLSDAVGRPVHVIGLIAVIGAHEGLKIKAQPMDGRVFVVPRKQLARWLERRPETLLPEEIARIYAAARLSNTWKPA